MFFQNKWVPLVAMRPHGSRSPPLCPPLRLRQVPEGRGTKDSGPGLAWLWCTQSPDHTWPGSPSQTGAASLFLAPSQGRTWWRLKHSPSGGAYHTQTLMDGVGEGTAEQTSWLRGSLPQRWSQIEEDRTGVHILILGSLLCQSPGLGSLRVCGQK